MAEASLGKKIGRTSRKTSATRLRKRTSFNWAWLQIALIVLAGLWTFWPAVHGGWIGDDSWYLSTNPLLNDPARLWKAWFNLGSWVEYYPIQETVQWVQWRLWHNNTFGYHLTNITLHIISGLLIWRLLSKFHLRLAWLGGLIFVVHPMMVDSVALVNELKASLSLPPFLLALCAWVDFEETGEPRHYLRTLIYFIVAMLCKITMAMFPVIILLYAWWKRGCLGWRDLKHTIPFFIVSFVLGILTIWAGEIYAYDPTAAKDATAHHAESLLDKCVLAGQTIAFYFSRCFLPLAPSPLYHKWRVDSSTIWQYLPYPVLLGVMLYLWSKRATWGRHTLLGLGFFVIMLMPFLGFNWISYMAETWVLEHLLYIPILGLIGLTVAGIEEIGRQLSPSTRVCGIGLVIVTVAVLAWISHGYASMFTSEGDLSGYVIRQNPNSVGARYSYGTTLVDSGHYSEALEQFAYAVQLMTQGGDAPQQNWSLARAYNNYGIALANLGRYQEAKSEFILASKTHPKAALFSENLGNTYLQLGDVSAAIEQYKRAVTHNPYSAHLHLILGVCLARNGQFSEAIEEYQESLKLDPQSVNAHYFFALALRQLHRIPEAIEEYEKVLALQPENAQIHNELGTLLAANGQTAEAKAQFETASRLNPSLQSVQNGTAQPKP